MCGYCENSLSLARGYCRNATKINEYIELCILNKNNEYYLCSGIEGIEYEPAITKINYCPMCGRKLGE